MRNWSWPPTLYIPVIGVLEDLIALDQLPDAVVEGIFGGKSHRLNFGVGDDVVSLVRVLAYGVFIEGETGNVLLNLLAKLLFREIRIR